MQELKDKILNSRNLLVVLPEKPKPDILASVLSFALALENTGKKVRLICESTDKICNLLKIPEGILSGARECGDILISIDIKDKKLRELKYEKLEDRLHIYIDAGKEGLKKDAVLAKFAKSPYDLILVFGASGKEDLGSLYAKNQDMFDGVDIEYIKSDSYFKLIFNFLTSIKTQHTKDTATGLLASAVLETANFRKTKEPNLFKAASFLIEMGADHQAIMNHLYNGIEAKSLKHTGLILKNASYLANNIISKINNLEMKEYDLNLKNIINALHHINYFIAEKDNFIVLAEAPFKKEEEPAIFGVFVSSEKENMKKFARIFNSSAHNDCIIFSVNADSLGEAEQKIITLINYAF